MNEKYRGIVIPYKGVKNSYQSINQILTFFLLQMKKLITKNLQLLNLCRVVNNNFLNVF